MAAWIVPALKAVLPHVGTIISATLPVFTRKAPAASDDQIQLLQQQITELQLAASQNAAHVRELAEQLQQTVSALEQAAAGAEAGFRRAILLCLGTALVSLGALAVAAWLVATH